MCFEVTSIIVIVSFRSPTPCRQSLDTCRALNSKVSKVSDDRILASPVPWGHILCGNEGSRLAVGVGGEGGSIVGTRAIAYLSGAKGSGCP